MIWALFLGVLKLILLGLVALYAVLILMTLRTEGTHCPLRIAPHNPARSAGRLLVWLGLRTAAAVLSALEAGLNILEDTSADVGEWMLHRRSA